MNNQKESAGSKKKPDRRVVPNAQLEFERGRVPPQAIDLEEAVLGALMLGTETKTELINILHPEVFYKESNKIIFNAILELRKSGTPVDILLVVNQLKTTGELDLVGGAYYISKLTNRVASDANLEWHARIIYQKYIQREIIRTSAENIKEAYDDSTDPFELLEKNKKGITTLLGSIKRGIKITLDDISKKYLHHFSTDEESEEENMRVYKTGWKIWDDKVETRANKIILMAGAAGDGKSKLASNWMFRVLKNHPEEVCIKWVTLEDSAMDVASYFFSALAMMTIKQIKRKIFNQKQKEFMIALNERYFSKFDIEFIQESVGIDAIADDFEAFCDEPKRKGKLKILLIDNILSLADRQAFGKDLNSMYDYIMDACLRCKQRTGGLIIPIHHFRDDQLHKSNIVSGYRPNLTEIKGTEAFRRVPNQVLLINTPGNRKDLMQEYYGEKKEILKRTMIIDPGKVRDDENSDDTSLMYMYAHLGFSTFFEIPRIVK